MAYCLWEQYFHNAAYDMDTGKMLLTQLSNKNTEEVVLPTQGETKAFPCFDYFSNNLQTFLFCLIFSLIRKIDFFFFFKNSWPSKNRLSPRNCFGKYYSEWYLGEFHPVSPILDMKVSDSMQSCWDLTGSCWNSLWFSQIPCMVSWR